MGINPAHSCARQAEANTNLLSGRFCSAQIPTIMGIMMVIIAVALTTQLSKMIGTEMPSMILKSEDSPLISVLLSRLTMLVLPTAAPTTNMAAIITMELLSIPPQAALKSSTPVISSAMGIIMAATWILTLPDRIRAINSRNMIKTMVICGVISLVPLYI